MSKQSHGDYSHGGREHIAENVPASSTLNCLCATKNKWHENIVTAVFFSMQDDMSF